MFKNLSLCILFLGFILIGECYDLHGGDNKVVIGLGSDGTASSPPVYSYPKNTIITRDPSNYVVPVITLPQSTSTDSTSTDGSNLSGSGIGTMMFTMTSDVAGTGSFAVRSKLDGQENDYKAYQSISAKYGILTQSRKMRFAEDEETSTELNYTLAKIDSQDSIKFFGRSYSDISKFQNKNDLIQEFMRAGAISKTSQFSSQYLQLSLDNANDTKTLYNNYTAYNIDTRFVGSSDLHAITNGTEIMQSYIGQIALTRKISSQFMGNDTFLDDYWLPCCNLANDGISHYGNDI